MFLRQVSFIIFVACAFSWLSHADTAQILTKQSNSDVPALSVQAQEVPAAPISEDPLAKAIKSELSKRWPEATIDLTGSIHWLKGFSPDNRPVTVTLQDVTPRGEAMFLVVDKATGSAATGWVNYAAWIHTYIALRKISAGEKLVEEMLSPQDINAATGTAYEYRGAIFNQSTSLAHLESRQTILEGQFLTTNAVQKIPDVRRGDSVRIRMMSGGLSVSTQGIAEEAGYTNNRIRVMANRNKREFVGELGADGIVEVKL